MSEIGIELLERYLADKASAEERRRVEAWLAEEPRRWSELRGLRETLEARHLSDRAIEEALTEVWGRLAADVGADEGRPIRLARLSGRGTREFSMPGRRMRALLGVAAALVLTIGGGVVATVLIQRGGAPPVAQVAAATARGERATFRLPDGTRVMLGVASTLRYPKAFPTDERVVVLEGEAYFDVVHEDGRPFVVQAGGVVAKDLGTQFTVRAYPEDPGAQVVVREGKVAIRSTTDGPERVVAPGELGRLGEGGVPMVEPVDTLAWFAWTEGRLVFDDTPLREALPQLGRWFDLEFRLADSPLGDLPLSASLRTEPTPEVLNSLSASLGLRQRREGRTVTLYRADSGR
jgi:transmembrane sensor